MKVVHFGDLNLTSEHGQKVLHRRVRSAVRAVCNNEGVLDLATRMSDNQCRKLVWSAAQVRMETVLQGAKSNQALASATLTISAIGR